MRRILIRLLLVLILLTISKDIKADNMNEINLPKPFLKSNFSLEEAIAKRRSVRNFSSKKLTLKEIGQLLWAAQGITKSDGLRAAPSAGAHYPLTVYVFFNKGVFRYIPETHTLKKEFENDKRGKLASAAWNQPCVKNAPLDIVICAIYEKVTSKYGERGIRYTDMEAGHAAENIHLQAVAMGLSSVPVGAFNDKSVSKILNLEKKEKPLYIIPIEHKETR